MTSRTEYRLAIIPEIGDAVIDTFDSRRNRSLFGLLVLAKLYADPQDLGRMYERPDELVAALNTVYGPIRTCGDNADDGFADMVADALAYGKVMSERAPLSDIDGPRWDSVLADVADALHRRGHTVAVGITDVAVPDTTGQARTRDVARRQLANWDFSPDLSHAIAEREPAVYAATAKLSSRDINAYTQSRQESGMQ